MINYNQLTKKQSKINNSQKMSNYSQLQRQKRIQIQQIAQNEISEIHIQRDDNRNSKILNKIEQVKGQLIQDCEFCDYQGIRNNILKHMKNSHKDEFLAMGENSNKYSKCEVCKKLLKQKNIEKHQFLCAIKEDSNEAAKESNIVRSLQKKNQQKKHNSLLKKFGIDTEINPNYIIQSQESNYSENEFTKSILNGEIFITKKKVKTNEEKDDNEQTIQTLKKIPLKQPTQSQNESLTNILGELNLNNDDQEGDTTKKKQLLQ